VVNSGERKRMRRSCGCIGEKKGQVTKEGGEKGEKRALALAEPQKKGPGGEHAQLTSS